MLNISENKVSDRYNWKSFTAFQRVMSRKGWYRISTVVWVIIGLAFLSLFLPWTQNIVTKGYVTTLLPQQRPQAIQSVIGGQIEEWYVREGDFVEKGDTIMYITEVKAEYFDPELVQRTEEQVMAKAQSVDSYGQKVRSLEQQYKALEEVRDYKIQQTQNKIEQTKFKIEAARADLEAYRLDNQIAQKQYDRTKTLYDSGLKSLTDLEIKNVKLQETQAKVISQDNKLLQLENELANLNIALSGIQSEYADKMAKSQSEKFSAVTSQLDATAGTAKLRNQLRNYSMRQGFYYITAPQSGFITKAIKKGIGEVIKEGTDVVTIMPSSYQLAVELYVKPMDLPLLKRGQEVRLLFDGWPAIVFSGWPNASFGTFSGQIFAIDQFVSDNGKYRILVAANEEVKEWPDLLRVGSGSRALILLNNVSLGYELWRQLNGFPPDFYKKEEKNIEDIKMKAPLKSLK